MQLIQSESYNKENLPNTPQKSAVASEEIATQETDYPEEESPKMPRLIPEDISVSIPKESSAKIGKAAKIVTRNSRSTSQSKASNSSASQNKASNSSASKNKASNSSASQNKASNSTVANGTSSELESQLPHVNIERTSLRHKSVSQVSLRGRFKCEQCQESFESNGSLITHKIRKHQYETERMKANKTRGTTTPQRNLTNKRSSSSSKQKTPANKTVQSPIKKPVAVAKPKTPTKPAESVSPKNLKSPVKSAVLEVSITKETPEKTELNKTSSPAAYEDESHECEICFRVLRSWIKFVHHSQTMHNFTPKVPEADNETATTSQDGEMEVDAPTIKENAVEPPTVTPKETVSTPILSQSPKENNVTPASQQKNIECPICHAKFQKKFSLNIHCRKNHNKFICLDCSDYFDSKDDLENHALAHDLQEQLTSALAKVVPETNTEPDLIAEHENDESPRYECLYCYSSYTQKSKLPSHYLDKHKLQYCSSCSNGFTSVKSLESHRTKYHTKGIPNFNDPIKSSSNDNSSSDNVKCKACALEFLYRSSLFLHIRKTHKKIPCYLCLDVLSQEDVEEHKSKCLDPYLSCLECNKTFSRRIHLQSHMKKEHSKQNKKDDTSTSEKDEEEEEDKRDAIKNSWKSRYADKGQIPRCSYCSQEFDSTNLLWSHLKFAHPKNEQYRCPNCQKIYFTTSQFTEHTNKCGKTVQQGAKNKQQEAKVVEKQTNEEVSDVETEEQPSQDIREDQLNCPICNKNYSTWQNVNRHIKDVHNPSTYKECQYCLKAFVDKVKWKQHEELHTIIPGEIQQIGTIPLKQAYKSKLDCPFCDEKFSTQKSLNIHAETHFEKNNQPKATASSSKKNSSSEKIVPPSKRSSLENDSDSSKNSVTSSSLTKRGSIDSTSSKSLKNKVACKFCKIDVSNYGELLSHIQSKHQHELYLKCNFCDKIYYDFGTLNKHEIEAHPQASSPSKCKYCTRTFTKESQCANHEKSCKKRPSSSSSSGDDENSGSESDSSSSQSSSSQTSHKSKIPSCIRCGAKFKTPELLVEHIQEHAKELKGTPKKSI